MCLKNEMYVFKSFNLFLSINLFNYNMNDTYIMTSMEEFGVVVTELSSIMRCFLAILVESVLVLRPSISLKCFSIVSCDG